MDSGSFGLEIWKDEDLTQAIAIITTAVYIPAGQISPGRLNKLSIKPLVLQVQQTSML